MVRIKRKTAISLTVTMLLVFTVLPAYSKNKDFSKPEELVTMAKPTFKNFVADENMVWFRNNLKHAKAIMIVPRLLKGGFIIGGSGGSGVLLARDTKTGAWSNPAFYTMGSVSFGLQIGGAADQIVLMIMTKKAMDSYLSGSFKLGADVSAAAGPVGKGVGATYADIYAFNRSKGIFGGLKIDGAVIAIRDKWNNAYYGKQVRPTDILILRNISNSHAADLCAALAKASHSTQKKPSPEAKGRYHIVSKGDTLYRIAKENGVSVDELCRLNNIGKADIIHPGQKLLVSP